MQLGKDVWCVFGKKTGLGPRADAGHGAEADPNFPNPDYNSNPPGAGDAGRVDGSTVLFTGNVVVSGSLYAERQIIEVDNTVDGNFLTPNNSTHYLAGGASYGSPAGTSGVTIENSGNILTDGFVQTNTIKNHSNQNLTLKRSFLGSGLSNGWWQKKPIFCSFLELYKIQKLSQWVFE